MASSHVSVARWVLVAICAGVVGLAFAFCASATEPDGEAESLSESDWLVEVTRSLRAQEYHLRSAPGVDGRTPHGRTPRGWTAPNRAHDIRVGFHDGEVTITPRRSSAPGPGLDVASDTFGLRLFSVDRADRVGMVGPVLDEQVEEGQITWRRLAAPRLAAPREAAPRETAPRGGSVTERYSSNARGIAVRLTLEQRPDGAVAEDRADEPVVFAVRVPESVPLTYARLPDTRRSSPIPASTTWICGPGTRS